MSASILTSDCLFARKFDAIVDEGILDLIDADLRLDGLPAATPTKQRVLSHPEAMPSVALAS